MKKTLLQITLGPLFLILACATPGHAVPGCTASITLDSDTIAGTNGVFDYDVSTTCQITEDTEFVLGTATNGLLSGVTGESVLSGSFLDTNGVFADTFSSTSASFQASDPINPFTSQGTLVVDCSSCAAGSVGWYIGESPEASGSVTGPVAAVTNTPEPSSLLLLIAGLAALSVLAGFARSAHPRGLPADR